MNEYKDYEKEYLNLKKQKLYYKYLDFAKQKKFHIIMEIDINKPIIDNKPPLEEFNIWE